MDSTGSTDSTRKPVTFRLEPEETGKLKVSARFHGRSQNREVEYAIAIHNIKTYLHMLDGTPFAAEREAEARRELARLEEEAFGRDGIDALIASMERHGLGTPTAN